MSISDTTSRINIMNIDCLLLICESITQRLSDFPDPIGGIGRRTHEIRPHNDIRAVSQVCRRWRESLLGSPRIWGRVVDFGVQSYSLPNYRLKRGEWLEEVLKRAGSAVPLCITGDVGPFYVPADTTDFGFDAMSFFIRLLESQWERIEVLSVGIGQAKSTEPEAVQTRFFCRAPVLKHFEVLCHSPGWDFCPEEVHFASPRKLFANYAPSLRTMNAEDIPFDMDSPWISGIREMAPLPTTLTISEVIVLLQRMPFVEKFQLAHFFSDLDLITTNPTLHLPNLTSLIFNNDSIASTAKMMECLSMDRLSGLTIKLNIEDCGPMEMDSNPDILLTFKNVLARYISNYFVSKPSIRNVKLWSTEWCLSFDNISSEDSSRRWQSQKLDLHLGCYGRGSDEDKREMILSMLDAIPLASTQNGHPNASNGLFSSIDELTLSLTDTPVTIYPNLRLALARFHHIQLLKLTDCGVESFLSLCISDQTGHADDHDHIVLFPELHTLWISDRQGDVAGKAHPSLADFLLQRKQIGYPITRLDLTDFPRADAPDLDRLDKVDGLEVIWKKGKAKSGNSMTWWGSWEVQSHVCSTPTVE